MIDVTWNLFKQTGNIETYLLLKELENDDPNENNQTVSANTKCSIYER